MNRETLERLYDVEAEGVYRYALALAGREEVAKDLLQDVFVKVASGGVSLAGVRDVRAYLFRMARNLFIDRRRRDHSRRERGERWGREFGLEARGPDPDQRELVEWLEDGLAELPEEQRSAVVLHLWDEMSIPPEWRNEILDAALCGGEEPGATWEEVVEIVATDATGDAGTWEKRIGRAERRAAWSMAACFVMALVLIALLFRPRLETRAVLNRMEEESAWESNSTRSEPPKTTVNFSGAESGRHSMELTPWCRWRNWPSCKG